MYKFDALDVMQAPQASPRQDSQALNISGSEPSPFMTGGSFALLPPRVAHPSPDSVYNMMNFAGSPIASPRSTPVALGGPGGMGEMSHFDIGRPPEWIDAPYGGAPAQAHAPGFWPQDYTYPAAAYAIGSFATRSPPPPPPPPPPPAAAVQQFSDAADHGYLSPLPLNTAPLKGDPNFADRHGELESSRRRCPRECAGLVARLAEADLRHGRWP